MKMPILNLQEKQVEPRGLEAVGSTLSEAGNYIQADRPIQKERIRISGAKLD